MKKQIIIALISIGLLSSLEIIAMDGGKKRGRPTKKIRTTEEEVSSIPSSARSDAYVLSNDSSEDAPSSQRAPQQATTTTNAQLTEMQLRALGQWALVNKQFIQTVFEQPDTNPNNDLNLGILLQFAADLAGLKIVPK